MDIKEARKQIDSIDAVLVREFEKRLTLIKEIGKYKDEHHLPLVDEERDKSIIDLHSNSCENKDLAPYIENYLKTVVSMSNEFLKNICISIYSLLACQVLVKLQSVKY